MTLLKSCSSFARTGAFREYADGRHLAHRRYQKYRILHGLLQQLELPGPGHGRFVDFGCADGAIPVTLLESDLGSRIGEYTGITLLDYNDLGCETSFNHPRFRRVTADLQVPISNILGDEFQGQTGVVTAMAFFHYLENVKGALDNAKWLLRENGMLIASIPARWVLRFRLNPVLTLGRPITAIRQVRSRESWEDLFIDNGWDIEKQFTTQCTGLRGPFVLLDKAVDAACRGSFGANMFFCLRPRTA
jgi:SAM-dependent methyltransferase